MHALLSAAAGALVIAGGAIADDHGAIHRALLDRRPEATPLVVIIPAASAEPATSGERTRDLFLRHGAATGQVEVIELAVVDDPATPADESTWKEAAEDPRAVATVGRAGAIWFTGGDQSRITQALFRPDGSATPLLEAIRARHAAGAAVGGTSAGAAALSDPMILGGDPVAAAGGAGEPLAIGRGLGLLSAGIADQHFDVRYRLPRLLKALALRPEAGGIGYGVAEDTALIVEGDRLSAVGRGLVTVVDMGRASQAEHGHDGVALRFLADGQSMLRPRAAAPPPPPGTRP